MKRISLKQMRKEQGITQKHLAARLEVDQAHKSRFEKQHDMQITTLRRYLGALGKNLRLVTDENEEIDL